MFPVDGIYCIYQVIALSHIQDELSSPNHISYTERMLISFQDIFQMLELLSLLIQPNAPTLRESNL